MTDALDRTLRSSQAGDREAFASLVRTEHARLHGVAAASGAL